MSKRKPKSNKTDIWSAEGKRLAKLEGISYQDFLIREQRANPMLVSVIYEKQVQREIPSYCAAANKAGPKRRSRTEPGTGEIET